ncbi:hypothetical protein RJG79_10430 [Mycoplasmatota bacterium WC44]
MMDFITNLLNDYVTSSISLLLEISLYIFTIMMTLEILKNIGLLEIINSFISKFTKYLGISKGASMALLVGYIIGITYGSGVILASYKRGDMNEKDVLLVSVFLILAHAILEDSFLFARFGANFIILVVARTLIAILATMFVNKFLINRILDK